MNSLDKLNGILFIRPNAEFVIHGNEIIWLDKNQTQPTDQEINAGIIAYKEKVKNEKAAAEAKLAALGLTTDDLKALGLGGN